MVKLELIKHEIINGNTIKSIKIQKNDVFWIQQKSSRILFAGPSYFRPGNVCKLVARGCETTDDFLLFYLPDGHFSIMFPCSAQDVAILSRAQSRHFVAVAVQLLQDLVAFCVQDVNLPFG